MWEVVEMAVNEARFRRAEQRLWESVGVAPIERRVRLPRTGVEVRVQEFGEGPPAVFVHGASNSGTSWADLVARLTDYRCILLDRPGCGLSEPLGRRLHDTDAFVTYAEGLVVDVLDALELESAHVVATSYGGYLALRAAMAHPDRVQRLVEFGWTLGAPAGSTPWAMRFANAPGVGRLMTSIPPNERAVRMILRQLGLGPALADGRFRQEAVEQFLSLTRDTNTMRNELDAGPRLVTFLRGMNDSVRFSDETLAAIRTPCFFLWGEDDPAGGGDIARAFAARVPSAELEVMPHAGHVVWIDDADHTAERTRAFLAAGPT